MLDQVRNIKIYNQSKEMVEEIKKEYEGVDVIDGGVNSLLNFSFQSKTYNDELYARLEERLNGAFVKIEETSSGV